MLLLQNNTEILIKQHHIICWYCLPLLIIKNNIVNAELLRIRYRLYSRSGTRENNWLISYITFIL